jgi:type VI secretion system secreted protein VgrG
MFNPKCLFLKALFCGGYINKPPQNNALVYELNSSPVCCAKASSQRLRRFITKRTPRNKERRATARHGANVLLAESFKAIETISGAPTSSPAVTGFKLQIDALCLDAHIALTSLIGQPVLLELQTDQSRDVLRPFHGHVTAAVSIGSNGGMARYRLTVEPWLAFLGATRDSATFLDQSTLDIVQSILADYQSTLQGAGKLAPLWRLDIADAAVYPKRSLTTQYSESDLHFINRLLTEEGLFYWFEHTGDATNATLGSHTLVIADHNGAFKPLQRGEARSSIRFSQSKGVIADDTIDLWSPKASWTVQTVDLASWDYRTLSTRAVSEHGNGQPEGVPTLSLQDTPGAYAYENAAQGQRLARNHTQALATRGQAFTSAGTVRALSPASTFTLTDHASASQDPFIVLSVAHQARNNLSADLKAQVNATIARSASADDSTDPAIFYRNAATVLPSTTPYRSATLDGQGQRIHPKPNVTGQQTALVIGVPSQHITTDRDHRIKIQFHWQRGSASSSRLAHPAPDGHSGAPAEDASATTTGTWVRVITSLAPIAGANWGGNFVPRIGQEVLVTFLGGDIDRPVVVGAVYNGQGTDNAQSNQIAAGAANATGNAPMWFPVWCPHPKTRMPICLPSGHSLNLQPNRSANPDAPIQQGMHQVGHVNSAAE